jgi:hypothetical protein
MNKRIQQITGQVLDELVPETWVALGYDKIKDIQNRTAELIVRECAKEAFKYTWNRENYDHYSDVGWDCLPGNLRSHIEEHFGVEE